MRAWRAACQRAGAGGRSGWWAASASGKREGSGARIRKILRREGNVNLPFHSSWPRVTQSIREKSQRSHEPF
eukprot:6191443-Pleurochrysis_carterae.AAC.2